MITTNQYDIFISYRRETGEDKARNLTQHLSALGYRVFFDHEAGMTGEFETEILAAVERAPVFMVLLTPRCFDRCVNAGDWVRREIERAVQLGKAIIPVRPNYDESIFGNLPSEVPDCIRQLRNLEFGEVDFHKNFKATVDSMVESMVKKVVMPTLAVSETDKRGAKIHFFSDISCRVMHFGEPIAVTDAADKTTGAIAYLRKGRHKLEYKSIENEADAYSETYEVPDNEWEDFVEIQLMPIKEKRKKEEKEFWERVEERGQEEKKILRNNWKPTRDASGLMFDDDDLFFCYPLDDSTLFVHTVRHCLGQAGYRIWNDLSFASVKKNLFERMAQVKKEAIHGCRCFIFYLNETSVETPWMLEELKYACKHARNVLLLMEENVQYPDLGISLDAYPSIILNNQDAFLKLIDVVSEMA